MPGTHVGLRGRCLLCPGAFADVVVFDLDALEEASTLEHPLASTREAWSTCWSTACP